MPNRRRDYVPKNAESRCRTCNEPIAWVYTSKRTGRKYPTNVLVEAGSHELVTSKLWFHKCQPQPKPEPEPSNPTANCEECGKIIPVEDSVCAECAESMRPHYDTCDRAAEERRQLSPAPTWLLRIDE